MEKYNRQHKRGDPKEAAFLSSAHNFPAYRLSADRNAGNGAVLENFGNRFCTMGSFFGPSEGGKVGTVRAKPGKAR